MHSVLVMCSLLVAAQPASFDRLRAALFDDISKGFIRVDKAYIRRGTDGRIHWAPGIVKQSLDCDYVIMLFYSLQLTRFSFAGTAVLPEIEPGLARIERRIADAIVRNSRAETALSEAEQREFFSQSMGALDSVLGAYARRFDEYAVHDPLAAPSYPCRVVFRRTNGRMQSFRVMTLTSYRMARAYGSEFTDSIYEFDKLYIFTCGTYVYTFSRFSAEAPSAIKIYDSGEYRLY